MGNEKESSMQVWPALYVCEPDLGYLDLRRLCHGYEVDIPGANFHAEGVSGAHQLCFRVRGGEASDWQRCRVYRSDRWLPVPQGPPDWILGGEFRARESLWLTFGPSQTGRIYWFFGDNRIPAGGDLTSWQADAEAGHVTCYYTNGWLSTVAFNNHGSGQAYDYVLELAVLPLRWRELPPVQDKLTKEVEGLLSKRQSP